MSKLRLLEILVGIISSVLSKKKIAINTWPKNTSLSHGWWGEKKNLKRLQIFCGKMSCLSWKVVWPKKKKKVTQNMAKYSAKRLIQRWAALKNHIKISSQQYSMVEGFMVCGFTASGPKQLAIIEKNECPGFLEHFAGE